VAARRSTSGAGGAAAGGASGAPRSGFEGGRWCLGAGAGAERKGLVLGCGCGCVEASSVVVLRSFAPGAGGAGLASAGLLGVPFWLESRSEASCCWSSFIGGEMASGRSGKSVAATSRPGVGIGGFIAVDGGVNVPGAYCSEVGRLPPLEEAGVVYVVLTD